LRPSRSFAAELVRNLVRKRDFYAGGLVILLGLVMALIVGAALGVPPGEDEDILPAHPEWLGWACILAGPLCFILFGSFFGLIPAIFACVFVSALGDRNATVRSAATLAAVVTIFGVGLFSYLLQVPMPLLTWRGL